MERMTWDVIHPDPLPGPLLLSLKYKATRVYVIFNAMEELIPECGAFPRCGRRHMRVS